MKKAFFSFLRIFVSLSLIVILLYTMRGKFDEILTALKGTNRLVFSLALLAFTGAITIASVRLKLIIEAQELPITFFETLSLTFIGYFFNNFLPTAMGGDVVKAYYLSKKTKQTLGSFTSVFVDRLIGLLTMILLAFGALFFIGNQVIDRPVRNLIYAITALSLLAIIFMVNKNFAKRISAFLFFLRPIKEKLKRAYDVVHSYRHHKVLIFQSFLISVLSQIFFFLSIGILALSIGSRISFSDILVRMPIISALGLLPSINGLGLREGSTVLLFRPLMGEENAFAVSVLWLLILFIISIVGGAIYAVSPQFKVRLKEIE